MSDDARVRSPAKPGDLVSGKYRVERILGSGGMGVVVAATHVELGQAVALKFIRPEAVSGKDAIERFMREARAVARLKSEHVARVFDVGRDENDRPYMVLELLEGLDLANLVQQKGPPAVADAVEYVLQACEALVEAHAAGIVHRDLKPQNIFVGRQRNGMPLVKVLDFGIAKAVGAAASGQMSLTESQAVIGSPLYMAPEQLRSSRGVDVRSDIWSLGVILYELLGGRVPFDGQTVTEVCIRVVNEQPVPLLSLTPGLDPALVAVAMRCLAKEPSQRWQNVAQLANALEPFSRSAQRGTIVRSWRSIEDTLDSRPRPASVDPDVTGPATAVTMSTNEAVALATHGGAAVGASGSTSDGPSPAAGATPSPGSAPLVSTNVAWGQGTEAPAASRRRSFTKGLAVGVVVSIATAAAIFSSTMTRSSAKPTVSRAEWLPPSAEMPPPAASSSAASASGSVGPVATALPTVAAAATPPGAPVTPEGRARPAPTTSARGREPLPSAAVEAAPNGAPILR